MAVAHSKSTSQRGYSEISSCNYAARAYGLKNGMFMKQAVKLCPKLHVVHYDFEKYAEVSDQLYRILFSTTIFGAIVQPVSVDEAYIELPKGSEAFKTASDLREDIFKTTGCTASVGVGQSMLTARLATKKAKPDGIYILSPDRVFSHLSSLPVADLPGVGYKHSKFLKEKGCTECKDIWTVPQPVLSGWLGESLGFQVYQYSRGVDSRQLKPVSVRKSVGVDINYGIRFTNMTNAEHFLKKLSEELSSRLKNVSQLDVVTKDIITQAFVGESERTFHYTKNYDTKVGGLSRDLKISRAWPL